MPKELVTHTLTYSHEVELPPSNLPDTKVKTPTP